MDSQPANPEPTFLPAEAREAMLAALFARHANNGAELLLDARKVAHISMVSDRALLTELLVYEADGDEQVAAVLARLGFSEVPVAVNIPLDKPLEARSHAIALAVAVTAAMLNRFEMDHFAVRDNEMFGSLQLNLPLGYGLAWPQARVQEMAMSEWLLGGRAVITSSPEGEPVVRFEIDQSRPGDYDLLHRSLPIALADLRRNVAEAVAAGAERIWMLQGDMAARWPSDNEIDWVEACAPEDSARREPPPREV